MLELRLGRAGCGKTTGLLTEIAGNQKRKSLLIVPEQASHAVERQLSAVGGNAVSLHCEVLSFTRLASRVFAQVGGLATVTVDGGGRILLMSAATKLVADKLTVYGRPSQKPAFLTGLLATLDECKQYGVTPQQLSEAATEMEGQEKEKMADLALIFGAYDALVSQVGVDPRDRLTRLADGLTACDFAQDMDIYLDGFTDFTPQQGRVLSALLTRAHKVAVALTCDGLEGEGESDIFAPAQKTARYLLALAGQCRVETKVTTVTADAPWRSGAIGHVEANLFADVPQIATEKMDDLTLYCGNNPRSEVEWTAAQILYLVQREGYRYRDIAVVGRGFSGYNALVEEIFGRYGIPVFADGMTDILQTPLFSVVTAALDIIASDFSYHDLFRYLKSGLSNIERDDCDVLENYAIRWNLRGGQWTGSRDWTMHPRGYGQAATEADTALLERLNRLRHQVVDPLITLSKVTDKTGLGCAKGLYSFLEDIDLPHRLERRAAALTQAGDLQTAQEEGQLWEILAGGLSQCGTILGDNPMEWKEFAQLLRLVLSQYSVGTIPVALDRVTAGDVARMGNGAVKAVFFLGADDVSIPQVAPAPGLFTDDDRNLLAVQGLELSPTLGEKLPREMTMVYVACSRPRCKLTVSWSRQGSGGEDRRPSRLIERLRLICPHNLVTHEGGQAFRLSAPKPALELAGQLPQVADALEELPRYQEAVAGMKRATEANRGALSPKVVDRLYGQRVPMSASRMDKYKSCHFAYFMQYGLSAKPRQVAGFEAPEYGTFVHYVLEKVLQHPEVVESGYAPDEKVLKREIKAIFDQYIDEELGGMADKTPRFVYLFRRLIRPVTQVMENVLAELAGGQFKPIAFELGFGKKGDLPPVELTVDGITVSLTGFVDRVDGWVKDDRLYLRVVDYKTGKKSFDLTEIWNGLGLQMLLYLFTLEERGEPLFGHQITPAGVLYLPAREAVIDGDRTMDEKVRQKEADKLLRRHGLLLHDRAVLDAMEPNEAGDYRFLPLKVADKSGTIKGESLVTAQRLGRLKMHTQRILEEIGRELAAGTITADPYWRGSDKNACQYCDYAAACHFEEGRGGDCRRWLPGIKNQDFWEALETDATKVDATVEKEVETDGLSVD